MKNKVFFKSSRGHRLSGILSEPSARNKGRMTILCHGFSSSKESRTNVRLEEILNNSQISTFRFDFFGHGESEGKFEEITISEAADDVLSSLKFLKGLGYVEIGLVGSSFGGMASLIAVSKTKDILFLALKSPVSDLMGRLMAGYDEEIMKSWKDKGVLSVITPDGEELGLSYSFFEDAEKVDGYACCEKIKIPTLIIHGSKDETVPLGQSRRASALIENSRLEVIQGADHRYTNPDDFEKMLDLISGFVIEQFRRVES
jgi:dipeptidyl aminopeptidase/acylaminoacyl peptidase